MTDDIGELTAKINKLITTDAMKALEGAMDDALDLILADAKANAPVAKENGGELRDSLRKRRRRRGHQIMGTVGTSSDHAVPLEFGTSKMSAQPYLYPALKANRSQARAILETALNAALHGGEKDG